MIKRENAFVEAMKFLRKRNNELAEATNIKAEEKIHAHNEFMQKYYKIKQDRMDAQRERVRLLESAQDIELATAIKAIYITALEAETLTDNGLLLAEELVDKWVATEGGAAKILRENKNKTYLLNRICTIVEEAALKDLRSIYESDDEDEDDISAEEDDEDVDYDLDDSEDEEEEVEDEEDSDEEVDYDFEDSDKEESDDEDSEGESDEAEEVIDDPETEEETPVEDEEDKKEEEEVETDSNGDVTYGVEGEKDSADNVTTDEEHDEPEVEDEVEKQMDQELPEEDSTSAEDIDEEIDDSEEAEADIEAEPENYDNKVLEDLDKEEDVRKAVALIRQRVADAEETFIKNNARDKEQINALLGKISDNIKTVEDMGEKDKENGKDAVAQENVKMARRAIDNITNARPLTIMEMFARSLNKDIVRDEALKEHYLEEDGSLDMDTIVESAKVLYGFLETLNTIQIGRKIDKAYLEEIF